MATLGEAGDEPVRPAAEAADGGPEDGWWRRGRLCLHDLQLPRLVHPVPMSWAAYGLAWRLKSE
jgi:hypothetical protein